MVMRIVLAVIVGVVVAVLVGLLGTALIELTSADGVGSFLKGVSGLLGLVAGLWYFFQGSDSLTR